ncbi:hypothetical protein GZH49_31640 [Nocardia terpenica]
MVAASAAGGCALLGNANTRRPSSARANAQEVSWLPGCIGPRNSHGGCAWAQSKIGDLSPQMSKRLQNMAKDGSKGMFSLGCAAALGVAFAETTPIGSLIAAGAGGVICAVVYDAITDDPAPLGPNDYISLYWNYGEIDAEVVRK